MSTDKPRRSATVGCRACCAASAWSWGRSSPRRT